MSRAMTCTALLCALVLSNPAVSAGNNNSRGDEIQRGIPLDQPLPASIQDCQDRAAQLASHGYCGQGDLACVARLEAELQNSVEKSCVRAIQDLKPKAAQP